jgi:hypothetical protein
MVNNLKELIKQIEKVEGVKLSISVPNYFKEDDKIFNDYPYTTPISGNKTVDDLLNERVYPILHSIENSIGDEIALTSDSNIIHFPNSSNIIIGLNNLNQMHEWFSKMIKEFDNEDKAELMDMYEGTYITGLIKQTMSKKKKNIKIATCD